MKAVIKKILWDLLDYVHALAIIAGYLLIGYVFWVFIDSNMIR